MNNPTADIIKHMISEIVRLGQKEKRLIVRLDEFIAIYRKEREI